MNDILRIAAGVAGLGGFSLALAFLLFRPALQKLILPQLTRAQAYQIINRVIFLFFALAVLGLLIYAFLEARNQSIMLASNTSRLAHLEEQVNRIEKARYPNLEELSTVTTLDLTGWEEVPPEFRRTQKRSEAKFTSELQLRKAHAQVATYTDDYGTSGLDPKIWSDTHPFTVDKNDDEHHVGADNLQRWLIDIDIADEPVGVPFTLRHHAVFYNSFQGVSDEWAETMAHYPGSDMTFTILFPKHKPCKKPRFYEYQYAEGAKPERVTSPDITISDDGTALTWRIGRGRLNQLYRVEWEW